MLLIQIVKWLHMQRKQQQNQPSKKHVTVITIYQDKKRSLECVENL